MAVGPSMGQVDTQACWLWGLALTTVFELLCGSWPHEVEFAPAGSGACCDLSLGVPFLEIIGSCFDMVWSHQVCWLRGFLGGTLVQVNATGPGLPTRSYKVIHASVGLWCACEAPRCLSRPSSTSTRWGEVQQQAHGMSRSASICQLSFRLVYQKCLWLYAGWVR